MTVLEIKNLDGGYGSLKVLYDIDFSIEKNQSLALVGRNGAGKSTLIKTIMGIQKPLKGEILFKGQSIVGLESYQISQLGISPVLEGRQIFPNLNVLENLQVAARAHNNSQYWTLEKVIALFPRIGQRLNNMGNQLSGGEQQMLAIARALMTNPELLILDEATEGLAPIIRQEIWKALEKLSQQLTLIIVDKNVYELEKVTDYFVALENGRVRVISEEVSQVIKYLTLDL